MQYNSQIMIRLLSKAIHNQIPDLDLPYPMYWDAIYEEAFAHQVHTLLYPALKELPSNLKPAAGLLHLWESATMKAISEQIRHIERMKEVLSLLNGESIPVILLKGLILRNYYPYPELRTMSDADLLVACRDVGKIRGILFGLGYREAEATEKHYCFYHKDYPDIEIHWVLSNMERNQNISNLTDCFKSHAVKTDFYGITVNTLSIDDQLLHLIIHLANHFQCSGFGVRQLCDFVLFCEANASVIDWEYCYNHSKSCCLSYFATVIFHLCHMLFGMDAPLVFAETTVDAYYLNQMMNDILQSGVYGKRSPERTVSISLTRCFTEDVNMNKMKGFPNPLPYLFPSVRNLTSRYSYAKKHNLLLPVAWFHRGVNNAGRILKSKEIKAASRERARLLHWLQLH